MVGAPQSRICAQADCQPSKDDIQAVGRVYQFVYVYEVPVQVLTGNTEFEQLGYSCDISRQQGLMTIAVSSVSKDTRIDNQVSYELNRAGTIQIYKQINSGSQFTWRASLKSDRPYSGFGNQVKVIFFSFFIVITWN